jgi:hypothetical protein
MIYEIDICKKHGIDYNKLYLLMASGEINCEVMLEFLGVGIIHTDYVLMDNIAKSPAINLDIAKILFKIGDWSTRCHLFRNKKCPKEILALPFTGTNFSNFEIENSIPFLQELALANPNLPAVYKVMI